MSRKWNEKIKGLRREIDSVAWTVGTESTNVIVTEALIKDYDGKLIDNDVYVDVQAVDSVGAIDTAITIAIDTATDGGASAALWTDATKGLARIKATTGDIGLKLTKTAAGTAYIQVVGYDGYIHQSDLHTWT